ncbi:hypothetical protein [Delftia acidovorans]
MSAHLKWRLGWFLFASSANWASVSAYLFFGGSPFGVFSDFVLSFFALVTFIFGVFAYDQYVADLVAQERRDGALQ